MAAALGGAEQDIEIGASAFHQRLVGPRIRRPAAEKIDVWRDDGARSLRRIAYHRQTGALGRNKISLELVFQLRWSRLVNPAHVSRCSCSLLAEFQDRRTLMLTKPRAIEIVVFIEHGDKTRQLFAHE